MNAAGDLIFTKMHGIGNDYIFIAADASFPYDPSSLAKKLSPRHHAVGSDGVILIVPSISAACGMRIFNADGSEAEMCGNGLRCVAKYVSDRGMVNGSSFFIETAVGLVPVEIHSSTKTISMVSVTLPEPVFEPALIPLVAADPFRDHHLGTEISGWCDLQCTTVNVGNPHCVIFVEADLSTVPVDVLGPHIENMPLFPHRINVEFVRVRSRTRIDVRVWERGSGETQACGSGASASVVAGVITGRLDNSCDVSLLGGPLHVTWNRGHGLVLTGPAEEVFEGRIQADYLEDGNDEN